MTTAPLTIPAGTRCLGCDYDLAGLANPCCPECGRTVTGDDLIFYSARLRLTANAHRLWFRWIAFYTLSVLACSIGAGLLTRETAVLAAAAVLGALVVGISLVAGAIASLLAPPRHRRLVGALWIKNLWRVHIPWLCVPPATLILCAVGWLEHRFIHDSDAVFVFILTMTGAVAWFTTVLAILFYWALGWSVEMDHVGLDSARIRVPAIFALLASLAAAALYGFLGGTLASMLASDLAAGHRI